jgi:hypothetical protein
VPKPWPVRPGRTSKRVNVDFGEWMLSRSNNARELAIPHSLIMISIGERVSEPRRAHTANARPGQRCYLFQLMLKVRDKVHLGAVVGISPRTTQARKGVSHLSLIITSRREGAHIRPFLLAEAEGNTRHPPPRNYQRSGLASIALNEKEGRQPNKAFKAATSFHHTGRKAILNG